MKTMNFLFVLSILFLGFSCITPETETDIVVKATNFQLRTEQSAFYEIYLHQFALTTELNQLKKGQKSYLRRIEGKDEKALSLAEKASERIAEINDYLEYNNRLIEEFRCKIKCPPKGPNPCGDMSCPIRIPDRPIEIWLPRDLADSGTIKAVDAKGRTSGKEISREEAPDTNFVIITMEFNQSTSGSVEITKPYKLAKEGSVSYSVPYLR